MPEIRSNRDITIVFDFDGVICKNNKGNYASAPPNCKAIKIINQLWDDGYNIVIATARYGQRHPGRQYQVGYNEAIEWLDKHNVHFHELYMGKTPGDLYIDDKGCRVNPDSDEDWQTVQQLVQDLHNKNQYGELVQ